MEAFVAESSLFKTPTRNRPKAHDAEVLGHAALALARAVLRDYQADFPNDTAEDLVADLTEGLRASSDGFQIGQSLAHQGWEIDAEMVELLNGWWLDTALRAAERAWVLEQQIVPTLAVGARVSFNKWRGGLLREVATGEIRSIDTAQAHYGIHDDADTQHPTRYYVVPYENVE